MNEFYETVFVTVNQQNLTLSNLFNAPYTDGNICHSHDNWFRSMLERSLKSAIGIILEFNPNIISVLESNRRPLYY